MKWLVNGALTPIETGERDPKTSNASHGTILQGLSSLCHISNNIIASNGSRPVSKLWVVMVPCTKARFTASTFEDGNKQR